MNGNSDGGKARGGRLHCCGGQRGCGLTGKGAPSPPRLELPGPPGSRAYGWPRIPHTCRTGRQRKAVVMRHCRDKAVCVWLPWLLHSRQLDRELGTLRPGGGAGRASETPGECAGPWRWRGQSSPRRTGGGGPMPGNVNTR